MEHLQTTVDASSLAKVINAAAEVLAMSPGDIGPDDHFQELGLDSILAVEFTVAVTQRTGVNMPAASVYEFPTPRQYTAHLVKVSAPNHG